MSGTTLKSKPQQRQEAPKNQTNTLDPKQQDWIAELAKDAGQAMHREEKRQKQQVLLRLVGDGLANVTEEIKAGQTYEVMQKNAGLLGTLHDAVGREKVVQSLDPGGDPNKEFDTGSVEMHNYKEVPPEVVKAVMEAQRKVVELQDRLRNATTDGGTLTQKPDGTKRDEGEEPELMFTPEEIDGVIAAEIWQPLVRQQVIPENAVPDRYSEVKQTFDGASAEYQKRLVKYSKTAPKHDDALRNSALGQTIYSGASAVATNVLDILKDQFPGGAVANTLKEVATIKTLIDDLSVIAFGVTDSVLKGEFDPGILDKAATAISDGIKLDKTDDPGTKAELAAIKLGCSMAFKSPAIVGYLAKGDPDNAVKMFGKILSDTIAANDTSDSDGEFKRIGEDVEKAIDSLVGLKQVAVAMKEGRYEEAVTALSEAITVEVTNYVNQQIEEKLTEENKDKKLSTEALTEEIEKAQKPYEIMIETIGSAPETLLALTTTDPKLKEILEKQDTSGAIAKAKENWDKLDDKEKSSILRMQQGATKARMDEANGEIQKRKESYAKLTEDDDASEIDKMIAEIRLQQARYTLAVKLASLPFQVIGALFPPARMGESLIALANELRLAAECGLQFISWAENVEDSRKGGSVQAEAMTSRMDLSLIQSTRHGIEASFRVVQIIGQGLTIAGGPVAHVGLALDKSASAGMAIKKVAVAVVDDRKAAAAWRIYQEALDRPQSRLKAREALRTNPTLAKYAIAYGAKKGNPFAANAMRKCGITDEVLSDENTGVDKVVTFLEVKFSEDPIVLRRVPIQDWYPRAAALTAGSWMEFVAAGETKANPKVVGIKSGSVAAALATLEKAQSAYDAEGDDLTAETVDSLLDRLTMARRQLVAVKPVDKNSKPHKEFDAYLKAMVGLVDDHMKEAADMREVIASEEKTFHHINEGFQPLVAEILSLAPSPGTPLAERISAFNGTLDQLALLQEQDDWANALPVIKQAKQAANGILDFNTDLKTLMADESAVQQNLFDQAGRVPPTDDTRDLLSLLAQLRTEMDEAQRQLDWEVALDRLDQAREVATEILGKATP